MTEIITIALLIILDATILCLYKLYEKKGLYYSVVLLNVITIIMSFKVATVFKMNINLGIVPLIANLSIIYIYINKYGMKEIWDILKISLISNVIMSIILAITNLYIPSPVENMSINIANSVGYNYKILITYPIIHIISEYLIIKVYNYLLTLQNNKIICMILTHIITSIVYIIIFIVLSYIKILTIKDSLFIGVSSYIIGLAIILINLLFIEIMTNKKVIK